MINTDTKKIKIIFIVIGGVAAFFGAVGSGLGYFLPDKSSQYASNFDEHVKNNLYLENIIYRDNIDLFKAYEVTGKTMPFAEYSILVNSIMENEKNRDKADPLINYLEDVCRCKEDIFCRVSNFENKYSGIIYSSWYLLEPYILEKRKISIKGYASSMEKIAIQVER